MEQKIVLLKDRLVVKMTAVWGDSAGTSLSMVFSMVVMLGLPYTRPYPCIPPPPHHAQTTCLSPPPLQGRAPDPNRGAGHGGERAVGPGGPLVEVTEAPVAQGPEEHPSALRIHSSAKP